MDEMEIVEYGGSELEVLIAAIRKLLKGVSALKVSLDVLNDRVLELKEATESLRRTVDEGLRALSDAEKSLEGSVEAMNAEVRAALDAFLSRFREDVDALVRRLAEVDDSLTLTRTELKDLMMSAMEGYREARGELLSLKSSVESMTLAASGLESAVRKLEEGVLAKMHELELMVEDLAARVSALECRLRDDQGRD